MQTLGTIEYIITLPTLVCTQTDAANGGKLKLFKALSTGIGIAIFMIPSTYLSLILLLNLLHSQHKESLSM